jgi:hypothetical protein
MLDSVEQVAAFVPRPARRMRKDYGLAAGVDLLDGGHGFASLSLALPMFI